MTINEFIGDRREKRVLLVYFQKFSWQPVVCLSSVLRQANGRILQILNFRLGKMRYFESFHYRIFVTKLLQVIDFAFHSRI